VGAPLSARVLPRVAQVGAAAVPLVDVTPLRPVAGCVAVALPDAVAVGEPEAGALAAAVAGVGRRGPKHGYVADAAIALGKGVGDGACETDEEGQSGEGLHPLH